MNFDGLAHYQTNEAFTRGVVIKLDHAPEYEFLVALPGRANRAFIHEAFAAVDVDVQDGKVVPNFKQGAVKAAEDRRRAFINHCLKSVNGEPIPANFELDYAAALDELQQKAENLAEKIDKEIDEAAKKSVPSLVGSTDGQAA